ncbi:MAG TPA: HEAT repeat domain-containing protein, partial [Gemmatimonadales bacterium]|nr:HEAT repeat domain-containing protein [Gemmatimonadales bacterium]
LLLAAAALLVGALFLLNNIHARRAERALRLDRGFGYTLRQWVRRGPSPDEVDRLSRLTDADQALLFAVCLRILPDLDPGAVARVRSGLERSGLLDRQVADLRHRAAGRRADACRVLGRLGCTAAVPVLIERLVDRDARVRRCALAALGDLEAVEALDRIVGALDAAGGWSDLLAIMALSRMGPASVPRVGALLEASTSPAMTKGLLQVTAQLGAAATPALVRALARHDDPEVRVEAVRALGQIPPDAESADVCLAALEDPAWPTRALAARSIGRLGDRRAIPRLERAMGDTAYWVRHHAGQALADLGEAGREALQRRLADPNPFVRDMATQMLFTSALTRQAPR